jgi:hypothetical protein
MTDTDDQTTRPRITSPQTNATAGDFQSNGGDTDMDTTMAAGPRSGAAGVANAELGTSGPPAGEFLSPEELAATEVTGGAGLAPNAIDSEQLADYLDDSSGMTGH